MTPIQWVLVGLIMTLCGFFGGPSSLAGILYGLGLVVLVIGLVKAHRREQPWFRR